MNQITPIWQNVISSENNQLNNIISKAQWLAQLNELFKQNLPEPLKLQCQVANYREECLIIAVSSATWATHLRYLIPSLTDHLKNHPPFAKLHLIRYYIKPEQSLRPNMSYLARGIHLSEANSDLLTAVAHDLNDQALCNALLKLAKHAKQGHAMVEELSK